MNLTWGPPSKRANPAAEVSQVHLSFCIHYLCFSTAITQPAQVVAPSLLLHVEVSICADSNMHASNDGQRSVSLPEDGRSFVYHRMHASSESAQILTSTCLIPSVQPGDNNQCCFCPVECSCSRTQLQDNDLEWLTSKDPSMQPKLSSLKRMFPQISHAALQNMLVANEGCLNRTVRVR